MNLESHQGLEGKNAYSCQDWRDWTGKQGLHVVWWGCSIIGRCLPLTTLPPVIRQGSKCLLVCPGEYSHNASWILSCSALLWEAQHGILKPRPVYSSSVSRSTAATSTFRSEDTPGKYDRAALSLTDSGINGSFPVCLSLEGRLS